MKADALELLTSLARQSDKHDLIHTLHLPFQGVLTDYPFTTKASQQGRELGEVITPFRPDILHVATLTGFLDAINAGIGGLPKKDSTGAENGAPALAPRIVHVEDYLTVSVKSALSDEYGDRDVFITAKHTPFGAFTFDAFYDDIAKFIIGVQVSFLWTENLLSLIKVASNLKAGSSIQVADDGSSQSMTIKTGEVTTSDIPVPTRLKLVPIRTFSEATAVETEFLVRFRQNAQGAPTIAIFNVDGTKWKDQTMQAIKHYLQKHLPPSVPILA